MEVAHNSNSMLCLTVKRQIPEESVRFMINPVNSVSKLAKSWSIPSHVVLFGSEERLLWDFLTSRSFIKVNEEMLSIFCSYKLSLLLLALVFCFFAKPRM